MEEKLSLRRPEIGDLSIMKVHNTSRPKPKLPENEATPTVDLPKREDRPVPRSHQKHGPDYVWQAKV